MKIINLKVEGFGVWSGLRIEKFADSLNVLYGPNEAGKTTLLQFIRTMFYGFSPNRRQYLPPVHGGVAGGTIDVAGPHGRFEIMRRDDGESGPQVTLTAPDGTRQGEHFLKVLLSNVDEPVFNNVFAVGLREIQELATLSDTEAAELLYSLSAGLDRVSLVDVLRELECSRNRILDAGGKPSQVVQLMAEREKILAEIDELSAINRRYGRIAAERDQFDRELNRLEEDANQIERQSRVMDLAVALRDRWARRASLDEQLATFGPQQDLPEGGIERLDAINARIRSRQERLERLARQREEAKREFASLHVNESLGRQAARIEALKEQENWIAQIQAQCIQLQTEIGEIESQLTEERNRLGLQSESAPLPTISTKALPSLRAPGNYYRQCRRRVKECESAVVEARQCVDSLSAQIESGLAVRGESDLSAAMDRVGGLVSQLRRRMQHDARLDQLALYQTELEDRSRSLVDRQLLPLGVLIGLGVVFVFGVMLVFVGLFMPTSITGAVGLTLALLGLAGVVVAGLGKILLERSNVRQLESCQKQIELLRLQIQQAKEDRDALDAQLPSAGAPIASRLQAAEAELASLEELAPLDARRIAARQEVEAAQRRTAEAKAEYQTARRRWREALASLGLPESIGPKQVRRFMQRGERIAELQRRLRQCREDLARRQRESDALAARIVQLSADAGVSLAPGGPIEQLRQLVEASARQEAAVARRNVLRALVRRNRKRTAKHEEAISRLKHRRRAWFIASGVRNEQEFRQRVLDAARADVLRRERDAIAREIEAALGPDCSEDAIARQLDADHLATLESRRDDLRERYATIRSQLSELLEKRGRLNAQLDAMAADKRLAEKYLDLAVLEQRLQEAVERWQVLAVASCVLDSIRDTYEKHRQPETLVETSGYLDRLTQGRYRRVWTPLGEHALRVDDADGHSLPVEVLSRGTREQLFLSLRLALASSYARRGAPLPLVLDDVLVNFDADRAKAAAAVLRDFAAAGHQMLIFTCHEHILKLFKSLHVHVSTLPNNAALGENVITLEPRPAEPPQLPKQKISKKAKPAAVIDDDRREPKRHAAKKRRDTGAFDADYFDSEEEQTEEQDDDEVDDDSLWGEEEEEEEIGDYGDDDDAAAA